MTALSTVYGDGESVSAVALHYPKTIDASRLKASDFTVASKTIDKVYTNDAPETALAGKKGSYVIVSLVHPATPLPTAASQNKSKDDQGDKGKEGSNALNGGDAPMYSDRKAPDLSVAVSQTGTIYATDGTAYGPTTTALAADKTVDAAKDGDLAVFREALAVLIDPQASGQLELSYEPCTDTPTPASQAATFLAADPGTLAVWQGERRRWTWAWSPE